VRSWVQNSVTTVTTERRGALATRQRILDAAVTEFAAHGLDGARIDRVAARAKANKRLIYAYVGNKQALWLAALERVYAIKRDAERALDVERLPCAEAMRALVRFNARWHVQHPEFIALLNAENLHSARHLRGSDQVRKLYSPLLDLIARLLAEGARQGVFRADVDPLELYVSIAGLSYFSCSNQHTLSAIFGRDLAAPEAVVTRIAHVEAVIMGYLRP
jgi:AcrR family transcriptional regulator